MPTLPDDKTLAKLEKALDPGVLSVDPADLETYGRDWTRVAVPAPSAVARPRTVAEVQAIVRFASEHDLGLVPSGGRTGLAGGAVAANGEIVVSLDRMRQMGEVDRVGGVVRVEAGAVTESVHAHAAAQGLTWPVDFASKGSSQIGGNIATNAGGVRVIRYGMTRRWVLGVEAVMADGSLMSTGGALEKNNTGFDLKQLFIGTEGTLGIVVGATLKLARIPSHTVVVLVAVDDIASVLDVFRRTRETGAPVSAYEFFTQACAERVARHRKLSPPFGAPAPAYALIELEEPSDSILESFAEALVSWPGVRDAVVSQHQGEAEQLWALRESISESLSATGLPHKNDVSLPIASIDAFCTKLDAAFETTYPGWEICLFGHIGDGNVHVNVLKPDKLPKAEFFAKASEADHAIFGLVRALGGSISAEHGIGTLKKPYLAYSRSPEEMAAMRTLKRSFDPAGIMNPGKVIDI